MTVQELIDELQKIEDKSRIVEVWDPRDGYWSLAWRVKEEEEEEVRISA